MQGSQELAELFVRGLWGQYYHVLHLPCLLSWLLRGTSNVWDLEIHGGETLFSESTGLISDKKETAHEAMVIRNSRAPQKLPEHLSLSKLEGHSLCPRLGLSTFLQ